MAGILEGLFGPGAEAELTEEPAEAESESEDTQEGERTEAQDESTETDAEAEPTEQPKTSEPGQKTAAELKAEEDAIFDDKALATKEGQAALRTWARSKRLEIASRSAKIEKKQRTLTDKVREFAAERDQTRTAREQAVQYSQRVEGVLKRLTTGTAAEILSTFGELTGKDPAEFYREISHLMASNGKTNGRTTPETEQLKGELKKLQDELKARQEREEQAAYDAALDRIYSVAVSTKDNAPTYPHIARYAGESPEQGAEIREALAQLKIVWHDAGSPITDDEAAEELDRKLAKRFGPVTPPAKTGPAPVNGQAPPPKKPPKQITSSDRAAPAQRLERAAESHEELAKDPVFMRGLFG